MNSLH